MIPSNNNDPIKPATTPPTNVKPVVGGSGTAGATPVTGTPASDEFTGQNIDQVTNRLASVARTEISNQRREGNTLISILASRVQRGTTPMNVAEALLSTLAPQVRERRRERGDLEISINQETEDSSGGPLGTA